MAVALTAGVAGGCGQRWGTGGGWGTLRGRVVPVVACRRGIQRERGLRVARIERLLLRRERGSGGKKRDFMMIQAVWGQVEQPKPTWMELEKITSEAQFDQVLSEAQERNEAVIIDWSAAWCRKCIYLKPKLEKLSAEYYNQVKFYYVDVNTVPQTLVKRAEVTKMPTIQVWKDGKWQAEIIGGHQAWQVLDEVREMISKCKNY